MCVCVGGGGGGGVGGGVEVGSMTLVKSRNFAIINLFTYSHGGNRNKQSLFDAASGPFKFKIGTLMWPCGTLKVTLNNKK